MKKNKRMFFSRKIEGTISIKRNIFTKKTKDAFEKKRDFIFKEINKVNDINRIIENYNQEKIKVFVFSNDDHHILKENFFDVHLIESSNLYNKYSVNEIEKNISEDKINVLALKDKTIFFLKKDKLLFAMEEEVIRTAFLREVENNIKEIDSSWIKDKFNIPVNKKNSITISTNENKIKFFENEKEITFDEMSSILIGKKSTIEFNSFLLQQDSKKNIYLNKLNEKTNISLIKSFFNSNDTKKKLKINNTWSDQIEENWFTCAGQNFKLNFEKEENEKIILNTSILAEQTEISNENKKYRLNLSQCTTNKRKIKINKGKSIFSGIMLALFISLLFVTFAIYFDKETISSAGDLMSNSFNRGWIYILIFATVIKVNTTFLIAWILTDNKKDVKALFRTTFKLAIAASISSMVSIITGLDYLGMVFWIWFMSKINDNPVVKLIGAIAVSKLFRSISAVIIGIPFMISGTVYVIQSHLDGFNSLILSVSWVGFFWINLSSAFIFIFVFVKPLNKHFFKIKYHKAASRTNNASELIIFNYRDITSLRKSMNSFSFKSKQGKRIIISITLSYIILCLQAWSVINIVMYENLKNVGINDGLNYFNFWKVISLKTIIANFNHASPVPGDVLVSEWAINSIFTGFYNDLYLQRGVSPDDLNHLVEISSAQTALLSRFWTFYLPQLYKIPFSLFGVTFLVLSARKVKRNRFKGANT